MKEIFGDTLVILQFILTKSRILVNTHTCIGSTYICDTNFYIQRTGTYFPKLDIVLCMAYGPLFVRSPLRDTY